MHGSRSEVLALLWGSLLFVDRGSVIVITVFALVFAAFAVLFNKELKSIMFSRTIASATGVHESFVYCLFLGLCGAVLAVNLPLVGGLLIFSLITCPAAAAYQVCTGHKSVTNRSSSPRPFSGWQAPWSASSSLTILICPPGPPLSSSARLYSPPRPRTGHWCCTTIELSWP